MVQQQLLKQESSVSELLGSHKKQLTKNIEQHIDKHCSNTINRQSYVESSISQIIRTYGKQFTQIRRQYTDGHGGRCVMGVIRSEEHTSELQSLAYLVCRLLLEKKKKKLQYILLLI